MNPIHNLFSEEFVRDLFKKRVLKKYPDFVSIKKIKIKSHKDQVWESTYHVVLEFETTFITREGKIKKLPIFCSAHSDEPRKNLYDALKYLWDNGFSKGYLTAPHPLFYSKTLKATFYRGATGKNFYRYIREDDRGEIENLIIKTARWFAKLHRLPTEKTPTFNKKNSRIRTTIPGRNKIIFMISHRYSRHQKIFENLFDQFMKREESFLKSANKRWLIHGDAHPENIIKVSKDKIALIDFNDLCLSDFTRDLGCFLQQFEYMAMRKIGDEKFINKMKDLFLNTYIKERKIKLDKNIKERIDNYYNWTAIRTATFFLLKSEPEPERAFSILEKVKKDMKI